MASITNQVGNPVVKTDVDLFKLLAKHDQGGILRTVTEAVLHPTIAVDFASQIGPRQQDWKKARATWRKGRREPALSTHLGMPYLGNPCSRMTPEYAASWSHASPWRKPCSTSSSRRWGCQRRREYVPLRQRKNVPRTGWQLVRVIHGRA